MTVINGSCPDASYLAELAAKRILVFLSSLNKPLEEPLEAFILAARVEDGDRKVLSSESGKQWIAGRFFSGPGIRTTSPRRREFRRLEASISEAGFWKTDVESYGYSRGTERLAVKLGMSQRR